MILAYHHRHTQMRIGKLPHKFFINGVMGVKTEHTGVCKNQHLRRTWHSLAVLLQAGDGSRAVTLLIFMAVDFATGLTIWHGLKNDKPPMGALSSAAGPGLNWIMQKNVLLLCVYWYSTSLT